MSKANAFITFGTKPSFSLLRSKKAAIAGVSFAGFSFSAVISLSSEAAILVVGLRDAEPRLIGPARLLVTNFVGRRITVLLGNFPCSLAWVAQSGAQPPCGHDVTASGFLTNR